MVDEQVMVGIVPCVQGVRSGTKRGDSPDKDGYYASMKCSGDQWPS